MVTENVYVFVYIFIVFTSISLNSAILFATVFVVYFLVYEHICNATCTSLFSYPMSLSVIEMNFKAASSDGLWPMVAS